MDILAEKRRPSMSIVLVHGNPETAVTWDELRGCLERKDVVAVPPPGFGAAVAAGFGATSDDYVAWLAPALATIPQPIDLVGHDWGSGHVARLAMRRPDLIRSRTMDCAGCFDPTTGPGSRPTSPPMPSTRESPSRSAAMRLSPSSKASVDKLDRLMDTHPPVSPGAENGSTGDGVRRRGAQKRGQEFLGAATRSKAVH
jgi:pimeloyl-ACP methyl ester carboxylesterase